MAPAPRHPAASSYRGRNPATPQPPAGPRGAHGSRAEPGRPPPPPPRSPQTPRVLPRARRSPSAPRAAGGSAPTSLPAPPRPARGRRPQAQGPAARGAMQLPPGLHARLRGPPGAAEPLPVERDPAAGASPFHFAARRVRFPREHEFFEDGDVQRHLYLQDVLTQVAEEPERPRVPEFTCQVAGCCQVFDSLEDYEHHYHTLHRNVCSFCRRSFPSLHLLDVHILEWHDSLFQILSERQDMYQCLVEGCAEKFKTSKDRKDHLVRRHLYPADFRFDKPKKSKGPATPRATVQGSAEALGDDGEQSGGDAMEVSSEHAAPLPEPVAERRTYSHRIPSTICFGQGASRGFKSSKKKKNQQ
uniref:C2H2-type domain-containing protein n=3 Tax=Canis lupus TaxID=9612 RepID=A0A8C0TUJ9_CANLF